jgi:hypothetical protein
MDIGFTMHGKVISRTHNFGRKPKNNILLRNTIMHRYAVKLKRILNKVGASM